MLKINKKLVGFCLVVLVGGVISFNNVQAVERSPDLVATGAVFKLEPNGFRTADVVITNRGTAAADPFWVYAEWLDNAGQVIGGCGGTRIEGLGTGVSGITVYRAQYCISLNDELGLYSKAVKMRIRVDYSERDFLNNLVVESNENNNTFEKNIPLSDLVATSAVFKLESNGFRTADVMIMNRGAGPAAPFWVYAEWLDSDGQVIGGCEAVRVEGLGVGRIKVSKAQYCISLNEDLGPYSKAVKMRIRVDYSGRDFLDNLVVESNENNNVFEKKISLSDLVVIGATFKTGENGFRSADIIVMNRGAGPAGPFWVYPEWLDGEGRVVGGCGGKRVEGLSVGRTKVYSAPYCISNENDSITYSKVVKLRVKVDASDREFLNNLVAESKENNNTFEKNIPLPDLKIEGINFKGTDEHPEVTIINKGTASIDARAIIAYEWYDINGERLSGCRGKTTILKANKRYTQKDVFCGNKDSYQWATKFKVTVDVGDGTGMAPQSQIIESNEDNNSLEWPIPGRENLLRLYTPEPDQNMINSDTFLLNPPNVTVPDDVLNSVPNTIAPETPSVDVPGISNNPVSVPSAPVPVVTPPPASTVVDTPPAVVEEEVRMPSFSMVVTQNGNDATVTGTIDYYGKGTKCSGPRPFDPVIVRWGDAASEPQVVNGVFTASHTYFIKNKSYTLSVSVTNSCYGSKTLTKTMLFTF